jgi:hypothetical protein
VANYQGTTANVPERITIFVDADFEQRLLRRIVLLALCVAFSAASAAAACDHCSPDGRFRLAASTGRPGLIVMSMRGDVERVLSVPAKDPSNAVLRSGWRGNGVVWGEAHVSPENSIYYEWDLTDAHVVRRIPESQVAVSRDGKHVAWVDVVAVHPSPDAELPPMSIDGGTIDPGGMVSALAWSPASDELAIALELRGAVKIVVYNAATRAIARAVDVPDVQHVRDLDWSEQGLIVRSARGEQRVR